MVIQKIIIAIKMVMIFMIFGDIKMENLVKTHKPNRSHAVCNQRNLPKNDLDFFPTPPWVTRALFEYVPIMKEIKKDGFIWEPACGRSHMERTIGEYHLSVLGSDIKKYDDNLTFDFLDVKKLPTVISGMGNKIEVCAAIITNPPFNLAEEFINIAVNIYNPPIVAMLVRSAFLEGKGRFERLYSKSPPRYVAQFSGRVNIFYNQLDKKGSGDKAYSWLVWDNSDKSGKTDLLWIPADARKKLEKVSDYA